MILVTKRKFVISSLYIFTLLLFCLNGTAQFTITPANNVLTPENLIKSVFLGGGLEVTNITYSGTNASTGQFNDAFDEIGIDRGIILSSGLASSANSAAIVTASDGTSGPGTDADLEKIIPNNLGLHDIVTYEISFIPTSDTLRFKYVFASEEYPQYICSDFNDVFGFFVTGPNPDGGTYNGENIALVPDPADPTGTTYTNDIVSINNVHIAANSCAASYDNYYNANSSANLVYGAFLDVFIAQVVVIPCEEYTIKLAISDVGDQILDSSVFLEAKSFGTGSVNFDYQTISIDGSIAEGCDPGEIIFTLPEPAQEEYKLGVQLVDCGNNATVNEDFIGLPDTVVFLPGEDSVSYTIFAIEDGIQEGDENLCFAMQRDICNLDTVTVIIRESIIQAPIIPADTSVCEDFVMNLDAMLPQDFILPDDIHFEVDSDYIIVDIEDESQSFGLEVSNLPSSILKKGMIKSVCIDTFVARYLTDYDFYLQAPSGQFIELSTDNGYKPLNGQDIDTMINTCFVPTNAPIINNGNPIIGSIFNNNPTYTGNFNIEGDWNDLLSSDGAANGTWNLVVIDDEQGGGTALLKGWSISFNPLYSLEFEWSSDVDGILCTNCPEYNDSITENKTYYLNMQDSYGCAVYDSFTVDMIPLLPPVANIVCDSVSKDFIKLSWEALPGATGYEISINGEPFIPIGTNLFHEFDNLLPLTEYNFTIVAVGGICGSKPAQHSCVTFNCEFTDFNILEIKSETCFGDEDGSIKVSVNGNFPPFSYSLNGITNSTGEFNNLGQQTDSVLITDASGCSSKFEIVIPGNEPLNLLFYETEDISCYNNIDGTTKLLITGGVEPYDIEWSPSGENNINPISLIAGYNVVTIEDNLGCILKDSIFINEPDPILIDNALQTDASCNGGNDGSAALFPSGGYGNLYIEWGDANKQTGFVANDLEAGDYIVSITDENGCQLTYPLTISEPAPMEVQFSKVDVQCYGETNGSAKVDSVVNGSNPFTYLWENGDTSQESISLGVGFHKVTITDANDCVVRDSVQIEPASPITITHLIVDKISCHQASDGKVQIAISGNSAPYKIFDNQGMELSSDIISDLSVGEHCYVIEDTNMCQKPYCFTLTEPEEIIVTEEIFSPTCGNTMDGGVKLTIEKGTPPYQVEWYDENNFIGIGEMLGNLNGGSYYYYITDSNMCVFEDSIYLEIPDDIALDVISFPIKCYGEFSGELVATITGGTEPFMIEWTGPDGYTSMDPNPKNLQNGTYNLVVTDSKGCEVSAVSTVNQPQSAITSGISPNDTICYEATNGLLTISPNGGTGSLNYTWSNGQTEAINSGLEPGLYAVTIVDDNNCSFIDTSYVIERSTIEINLSQSASDCSGSASGQASIESIIRNGISDDLGNYSYIWNSTPNQYTTVATDLKGGESYSVLVTDNLGCTNIASITIDNPEAIIIELESIKEISCADGTDGEITIKAKGGTEPYTYQWGQEANFQTHSTAVNLNKGYYTITVVDNNGCSNSAVFNLIDPLPIESSFRVFDVLCVGDSTGEIEAIISGGKPPYIYEWSTGGMEDSIAVLDAGKYYLSTTDQANCLRVDSIIVQEPEEPLTLDAEIFDASCYGASDGFIRLSANGGSGYYIYSLDNFLYNGSTEQIGLNSGEYTAYVKDKNGCIDSLPLLMLGEPNPIIVDLGEDVIINYGEVYSLNPTITNGFPPMTLHWKSDNIDLMTCDDCMNPYYNGLRPGAVILEVTDENGCFGEDLINIYLKDLNIAFVPTAFTPNNDFNNDLLSVYGEEGTTVKSFRIFDQWGELLYEDVDFDINDSTRGWDGKFHDKLMNTGVYVWIVEVQSKLGFNEIYKGNTTLIR